VGLQSEIQPDRLALRLARIAARVLPKFAQLRYREEFRNELTDLAQLYGASRGQQLMHSARLVSVAWDIRRALLGRPADAPERVR
jgi:hypothetical protein